MKDFIYINYGFKVNKIYNNYFFVGDEKIYIYKTFESEEKLEKLFMLTNEMYNHQLYVNTFIFNKDNKFYTKKEKEYIILLKANDRSYDVSLNYLNKYRNFVINIEEFDIINYWKNIIDNIENELVEYNKEHLFIQNSINYFIGMSENAITLMSEYKYKSSTNISHNINFYNYNIDSFNNPFNFIRLNRLYDISLYIKYNFYNNTIDYDELYNILHSISDEYDQAFLFSCLLFRNYYFDVVNKIIDGNELDEKLKLFIDKIESYEQLLSYCKQNLKKCKLLPLIGWID